MVARAVFNPGETVLHRDFRCLTPVLCLGLDLDGVHQHLHKPSLGVPRQWPVQPTAKLLEQVASRSQAQGRLISLFHL